MTLVIRYLYKMNSHVGSEGRRSKFINIEQKTHKNGLEKNEKTR